MFETPARHVLEKTRAFEDSVAIVFDRPLEDETRQVVFERMDWSHPNRRGYYERNKAFIAAAPATLASMPVPVVVPAMVIWDSIW